MIKYEVKVYTNGTKHWYLNGKFHLWKAGQVKRIKRAYNKRLRKHNKEIEDE